MLGALHKGWFQIKRVDQNNDNAASESGSPPGKSLTSSQGRKVHTDQEMDKQLGDGSTDGGKNGHFSEEEDTDDDL